MKSNTTEETLDQLRNAMESSLELPSEWVFVMRGAPVGRKAERKRTVQDLGSVIVIRDKTATAAAAKSTAANVSGLATVQVEGGSSIGSKFCHTLSYCCLVSTHWIIVLRHVFCNHLPEVKSNSGETLAQLRTTMESSLQLPAAWVFLLKGAPVGKKAEGKRLVDDLGLVITIRDKSGKSAPKTEPVASGGQEGVPVAMETGTSVGSISLEPGVTLVVARRMIQEKFSGSLPAEFVFLRNQAPVGMKQEKKLKVADCLPVLLLRDKALRRASAPPTPGSAQATSAPPTPASATKQPAATDAAMVTLVSESYRLTKPAWSSCLVNNLIAALHRTFSLRTRLQPGTRRPRFLLLFSRV